MEGRTRASVGSSSQDTRSIDRLQLGPRHQARGERVANATAERVDQVFFRVAVGRVVDPLATSALTAVCLEGVLQSRAPRVDQEVAAFQEQIQGLEPIQISPRAGEHRPNFSGGFRCTCATGLFDSPERGADIGYQDRGRRCGSCSPCGKVSVPEQK